MEDYRIPGIADTPQLDVHFDEEGFDHVPGGSAASARSRPFRLHLRSPTGFATQSAFGSRRFHSELIASSPQ
jgi:hypothetical protein